MTDGPKNIVHVSQYDIETDRTKHVTLDEISNIASTKETVGVVSFKNSEISTSGLDTESYVSLEINGSTYKFKLYQ